MNDDDRDLWDLLGRSARAEAPGFFAGRVMRRIAAGEKRWNWGRRTLQCLSPVAACLLIAAMATMAFMVGGEPQVISSTAWAGEVTTLDLVELVSPEDYETLTEAGWPYDNGFLSAAL